MEISDFFTPFNLINIFIGIFIGLLLSVLLYQYTSKMHLYLCYICRKAVKVNIVTGKIQDEMLHKKKISHIYTGKKYDGHITEISTVFSYKVKGDISNSLELDDAIKKHYSMEKGVDIKGPFYTVKRDMHSTSKVVLLNEVDIDLDK